MEASDSERSDSCHEVVAPFTTPFATEVVKMNSTRANEFERGRASRRKSVFPPSAMEERNQNDIAYLTATPLVIADTQTRGNYHPMTQVHFLKFALQWNGIWVGA